VWRDTVETPRIFAGRVASRMPLRLLLCVHPADTETVTETVTKRQVFDVCMRMVCMRGQAGRQAEQVRVYGGESVLRPGDVRQFVYQLVPRADSLPAAHKSWFDLGRLEMAWMVSLSLLMSCVMCHVSFCRRYVSCCRCYGVVMVSRIDKIIGLFCRILSLLQGSFAKETYDFIDPTNQSHPIHVLSGLPFSSLSLPLPPVHVHTHTQTHWEYECGHMRQGGGRVFYGTRWCRCIGCLIFISLFLQKSPLIGGSFAKRDLQLKASYVCSPPCTQHTCLLCLCVAFLGESGCEAILLQGGKDPWVSTILFTLVRSSGCACALNRSAAARPELFCGK